MSVREADHTTDRDAAAILQIPARIQGALVRAVFFAGID
jgi:hypothetical protein